MSYKSHKKSPKRYFDHLYDPVCKISGENSNWRANHVALVESAPIHVAPNFMCMFSELPREKRNCKFYQRNPLPFNVDGGNASAHKCFKLDSNLFLRNPREISSKSSIVKTLNSDGDFADKECQTLFRETSAQTIPCFPETKPCKRESKVPELIKISKLIRTNSQPGLKEVEKVERYRIQNFWEDQLLGTKNPLNLEEKMSILQAFGWDDWVRKEGEINEDQDARLNFVKDFLAEFEKENVKMAGKKLEVVCCEISKEMARIKGNLR
jgi:hypothetical protein